MYRQHFSTKQTPQTEPIPGKNMAQNNAGGYSFAVDDWTRLDQFLILGAEGGTYYVRERELTIQNAQAVQRCIQVDGKRVVARIVEISDAGRAPKNDPALFALAMCAGMGNLETRKAALNALPKVARIGTHLFHFMHYVEGFRGRGRGLRRAVGNWYLNRTSDNLAYQAIKYQQRDGWSHRDALRLAHPNTDDAALNAVFHWITQGEIKDSIPALIEGFERIKKVESEKDVISLITEHNLPWEAVPTQWLSSAGVWRVLLDKLPTTATLRNLGRLTANGLLAPMSDEVTKVVDRLTNQDTITKARLHPLVILVALKTYQTGHGLKGSLSWNPDRQIVDALDAAFYLAFNNVETTGKQIMLALDVSGSMTLGNIAGSPLTPREGTAAMAMVTARTEKNYHVMAFATQFVSLNISPRQRLDDVVRTVSALPFGGTDCALPILYAIQHNLKIDTFVVYTDSETWAGQVHPVQALQQYRQKTGIPAKLVVVGMVSNGFSIADPDDAGMLDIVGFDTATPQVISDFVRD